MGVGRLGVLAELKFRIVRQQAIQRRLQVRRRRGALLGRARRAYGRPCKSGGAPAAASLTALPARPDLRLPVCHLDHHPFDPPPTCYKNLDFEAFTRQISASADAFKDAKAAGDMDGVRRALHSLHETQAFWAVPTATVQRVDYEHLVGGDAWGAGG